MLKKKKNDIEAVILQLLANQSEIGLQEVARACGLSKSVESERKAIRRVLNSLIVRGHLIARGAARARVYARAEEGQKFLVTTAEAETDAFKGIALSKNSKNLLKYISKPIKTRIYSSYNQDFLRSYEPNRTYYLNELQRAELMAMGQVENKIRPAGTYARNILNRLLIDLSWNSSRLEGNTYSLLETKRLIELGEGAVGKNAFEAQMILNHKAAIEYIMDSVAEKEIGLHEICSIHALLAENLLGDPSACGRLRTIAVSVGGSTYHPLDNPHVLQEHFQLFIQKLNRIQDPFEQSFFVLVQLSYLQAFEDVNKRTARLVANRPLIKANLNPLTFTDVNQEAYVKSLLGIYEKNDVSLFRDLFVWSYKQSAQRYSALQQGMSEPNLLKFKYRDLIHETIRRIILEKLVGQQVINHIRTVLAAQNLTQNEKNKLIEAIETEVMSLHAGNIARFHIQPNEFQQWKNLQ